MDHEISWDQKNHHIDFLFGVHGADEDGIIAEQPSHFGFGISEISDEEKISCRPFQYLSMVKNKSPGTTVTIKGRFYLSIFQTPFAISN